MALPIYLYRGGYKDCTKFERIEQSAAELLMNYHIFALVMSRCDLDL